MDDFSEVTPELIHSAYVEAVYREDEWEYERLTLPFWKNMIKQASESQSSDIFYHHFPLKSGNLVDIYFYFISNFYSNSYSYQISLVLKDFIRPLFPFDCKSMGGCGREVVARMPKEYCAIDIHRDWRTYEFGHFLRR